MQQQKVFYSPNKKSFKSGCVIQMADSQNTLPVTAKNYQDKAILAVNIIAKGTLQTTQSALVLKLGVSYE